MIRHQKRQTVQLHGLPFFEDTLQNAPVRGGGIVLYSVELIDLSGQPVQLHRQLPALIAGDVGAHVGQAVAAAAVEHRVLFPQVFP